MLGMLIFCCAQLLSVWLQRSVIVHLRHRFRNPLSTLETLTLPSFPAKVTEVASRKRKQNEAKPVGFCAFMVKSMGKFCVESSL
jgi:hypothetical protein